MGEVMRYRVSGKIQMDVEKTFSKQIDAENDTLAREKIYVFFGNTYRLSRKKIAIERIEKA